MDFPSTLWVSASHPPFFVLEPGYRLHLPSEEAPESNTLTSQLLQPSSLHGRPPSYGVVSVRFATLISLSVPISRSEEARALLGVEIGQDRFDPAGDAEFAIDVVEVGLHGVERHTQLIGDVFIATPGRGTSQNLPLTLSQQC